MKESASRSLDQLPHFRSMVGAKIVHHDNGALMKARHKLLPHEVHEPWRIHGALERGAADDAVHADRSDDGEVFAPVCRLRIDDAFADRCAPVGAGHRDVASGLVEEDEVSRVYLRDRAAEDFPLLLDVVSILLGRSKRFFFQVTPARRRARFILDSLIFPPWRATQSAQSSATVRSGFSATIFMRRGNCSRAIRAGKPPPAGSRSKVPCSRRRRRSLEIVASPTPKASAKASYVIPPRVYRATILSLRSNDSAVTLVVDQNHAIAASGLRCRETRPSRRPGQDGKRCLVGQPFLLMLNFCRVTSVDKGGY